VGAALQVLAAVEETLDLHFEVRQGGPVAEAAEAQAGRPLPDKALAFCQDTFEAGGAILSGPGGGRYVYELRRHFDLFCKFAPIRPCPMLARVGRFAPAALDTVDMLIVRDNVGGVYQGQWRDHHAGTDRVAEHWFSYRESQVRRLAAVAVRAAASRRRRLHVVVKDGGIPGISALWRDVGQAVAREANLECEMINVDFAAYALIQDPARFDVLLTPNLLGDILIDVGGILLGSRGVTFSGNFGPDDRAVYQTNHGCAHDLAGANVANPAGQIFALAMLLRESFGLEAAARLMETAVTETWRLGYRTADLAEPGCHIVGTQAMAERIAEQVVRLRCATQPA
jgi:3-isopropylmalate dehydrogenase